ncbi:MAG TPA: hypothetical protein VGO47_07425 [Chlamydiales bacterium]|nr:hypothetical protein [Chlamydiales bacterium]
MQISLQIQRATRRRRGVGGHFALLSQQCQKNFDTYPDEGSRLVIVIVIIK